MKSIFDQQTRDELIGRVNSLNADSKAQWGKMNVYQMVKHCALWEDMMQSGQNISARLLAACLVKWLCEA